MKAYERLNVEVVKFEAQDVITASVAAPEETPEETPECICRGEGENLCDHGENEDGVHQIIVGSTGGVVNGQYTGELIYKVCPATDHDCVKVN